MTNFTTNNTTTHVYKLPIVWLLGLIFVYLKLAGVGQVATWSWLWVLAPFWAPFAIALAVFVVIMATALIVGAVTWAASK